MRELVEEFLVKRSHTDCFSDEDYAKNTVKILTQMREQLAWN